METMQIYKVYPAIPEPLTFLEYLSRNLWWCWSQEAIELFYRMNPAQWEKLGKNPVAFLSHISQRRFEALSRDESFIGHLNRVKARFEKMFSDATQIPEFDMDPKETIAYLSMEFGLHESLPFFAGGLGVLAGDHLKASSTLGIPLIGIGLLFREGYFRQYLDHNGWQLERYPIIDVFDLPVQKVTDSNGRDLIIEIPGPTEMMRACVWQIRVGKIRLLMLDTDLPENSAEVRDITSRLYASHGKTRVAQEALLGIGGLKVLSAMEIFPSVCHMNEGHCTFAGLERVSLMMDRYNLDVESALQICQRSSVFTTHTPVSAGHDEFEDHLVTPYLKPYIEKFGVSAQTLLSWGKAPNASITDKFSMFIFGTKFAGFINGVSRLHGQVARRMWQALWPKRHVEEIPISHVTNGIHISSYLSRQKSALFERYLASDWAVRQSDLRLVGRIDNIENSDLWHSHELDRSNLIRKSRQLLLTQYERRNAPRNVLEEVVDSLDHHCLTICFARRFATYKRAGLLLRDIPRLTRLITDPDRPIQFIFAGKAHPNDNDGKAIIQQIVQFSRRHEVRHRVAFLEDYDINIARYMVQGCDVWLNTPRRPYEACGTSGMKAAANGGLNLSILDGWWCEGFREDRGWAIGSGEDYDDPEYQDSVESQALFNILENDVIPAFYDRKRGNPPAKWIKMMKASMKMAMTDFSSDHMVREYSNRYYLPALINLRTLTQNSSEKARELALTQSRLKELWRYIWLSAPRIHEASDFKVGDTFRLTLEVFLGDLTPEEVEVQIYHGKLRGAGHLEGSRPETMQLEKQLEPGKYLYVSTLVCSDSGRFGYTARVIPSGDEILRHTPLLVTWAQDKK
ncbi:MAG: alpha-glucan family phosphorylase [Proteobacteria bacterium]|nr:alpha-glucan family phosphorylase [Pseudomonadota bacterium]MBU1390099.1 alpha-glucan family phosphorylase [Pseudomonadota bacterium]MBU1544950.1 alpha-glucan family phosphorylase [Pseudomonadota bacterium]MBU2482286.1 alpha-glucan family phosphorylase [Pseudomonadota bacterium]